MGAAMVLLLLMVIGLGVAYHMGILEPYIKEAQARLKQGGGGGGGGAPHYSQRDNCNPEKFATLVKLGMWYLN
ncbi:unnamed protein product [Thelazia callipaeda]|uniref:Uncharacterized protein n=1 Tax=Thelazia callipaeda TaxID=103827 RepID=A0A0N5D5S1_THECL|nr:unnamed protein product [Thelazia callipaeda]